MPGFSRLLVPVSEVELNVVQDGQGEPPLLLHGYPQTHVMWHRIAPVLAEHFVVVRPDLRGYGDSDKPASVPPHDAYSKRTLAQDQVELMDALGLERFASSDTTEGLEWHADSRSTTPRECRD